MNVSNAEQSSNHDETTMKDALPKGNPLEESARVSKAPALDPGDDFRGIWYTRDNSLATVEDFHNGGFTGLIENTQEDRLWDRKGNSLIASAYDLMQRINGTGKRPEVVR